MRDCSSTSVVSVNTGAPHPRPGPATPMGPDVDELRSAFDDLLADSADHAGSADPADPAGQINDGGTVDDHQVDALGAAHELLARALTELDAGR